MLGNLRIRGIKLNDKEVNPAVESIQKVFIQMSSMANNRNKYADEVDTYAKTIYKLVRAWATEFAPDFKKYSVTYRTIAKLNRELAKQEIRVANDIRDCYERFLAVDKFATIYNDVSDKYQSACDKVIDEMGKDLYEQRQPKYEQKKESLQANIAKAKANKKALLEDKKRALQDFINAREQYNIFKVRRLHHAFTFYSRILKEYADKEEKLYMQAVDILKGLQRNNAPQELQDALDDAPQPIDNSEIQAALEEIPQDADNDAIPPPQEIEENTETPYREDDGKQNNEIVEEI